MKTHICTLTERGQVSVPARIRKDLGLRPGQKLRWQAVANGECRVSVEQTKPKGPLAALGFGPRFRGGKGRPTNKWMRELRAGEG